MFFRSKNKRIYLDYAAATPVRAEVFSLMKPFFSSQFGNAGAIHTEGVEAKNAITDARTEIARVLHIRPQGVLFTASGTESNNLAIMGIVEARRKAGVLYTDMEIVTTSIEHASVLEVLTHLESLGVGIVYAPLDTDGTILIPQFLACLSVKTILVTCAYVNSEIGVIQQSGKLARVVRSYEKEHGVSIHIHLDAAQAPLWLPCRLDSLAVDSLALDAGKCYGPKGVGVLAYIHGTQFAPYLFGGGQEGGLRPGTLNTALIIGAVKALCIAQAQHQERSAKVMILRDAFIDLLLSIPECVLNGGKASRVANNVNVSILGIDAEFAVISLDEKGIACATKSACGGASGEGSFVVKAISGDQKRAVSSIRFTLGEETTYQELQQVALVLKEHVARTRSIQRSLLNSN